MNTPLLLHINTALNDAYVSLSRGADTIAQLQNNNPFDHAAFVQPAIRDLCIQHGIQLKDIQGVSVINGPGSYTGLRVGLSSAKGLCYALNIPLICINTLDWLAKGAGNLNADWICPMIDARRMEVFTALYDKSLQYVIEPTAMVLDENSFNEPLSKHQILFLGNGAIKWKSIANSSNAIFSDTTGNAPDQGLMAFEQWVQKKFADLAYVEPFYIKEFYNPSFIMKKQ